MSLSKIDVPDVASDRREGLYEGRLDRMSGHGHGFKRLSDSMAVRI